MFGCLFESEEELSMPEDEKKGKKKNIAVNWKLEKSPPPLPRGPTGLCGLQNQGATCYLNSLLQTLFFTPEFRNGLFRLRTDDLVDLSSGRANYKVRAIPLQLKKLFAQLLLLDKDSINTDDLTCSFGWTGNEGFQQHDVQELNRVLFSAIESSLVGTSGEVDLIRTLYHGTSITKVVCLECGKASEREEDYLDLPLTLSGCSGLEQSLSTSYVAVEILEGINQYKCETCLKHVNALKSSKIRSLPPILTFSLLRFDYDIRHGERFKETKRYSFPTSLSMKEFCECKAGEQEDQEYDLYSVVIHSGSCYGGHYHAYICDLEGLAVWTPPEDEHVRVVQKDNEGHEVAIDCDNPVDLLGALLKTMGGAGTVNQLCQCLSKETGHSWNKRFKSRGHGSLTKFFKKNSDVFKFSDISGWVSLQTTTELGNPVETSETRKNTASDYKSQPARCGNEEEICFVEEESSRRKRQWFDINDSRISCIRDEDLQCQFSGKESAYMLFYRRRKLSVPKENPALSIPAVLKAEVEEMNKELARNREEYDRLLNEISVCVHFGDHYTVKDGALELKQGVSTNSLIVALDRRKTVKDLVQAIEKDQFVRAELLLNNVDPTRAGDLSNQTLHIARHLAAGLHLFDELSVHSENSLRQCGIQEGTEVFFWNGKEVDGCSVYPGESSAPLLLNITYPLSPNEDPVKIQNAFRKNTAVGEIKLIVANLTGIPHQELLLTWMKPNGKSTEFVPLTSNQDGSTLEELHVKDGDNLVAEQDVGLRAKEDDVSSPAPELSEKHGNMMSFVVENRYLKSGPESRDENQRNPPWSVCPVTVLKDQSIGELKAHVLSECGIRHIAGFCRLRLDDDAQGLGPPLYEHDIISSSSLKHGDKLVLESGPPLKPGQLMIRYYVRSASHSRQEMEVVVDKTITAHECLRLLTVRENLEGMEWHLRKTDWFGEPKDALNNESETLEGENIKHGDTLIIEKGKLLPKGFICLSLWQASDEEARGEQNLNGVFTRIQGLLGPTSKETPKNKNEMCNTGSLLCNLEVSLDASLYDLKLQICALPQLADHVIPTPGFIRLQEISDRRLMRVLRGLNRSLRQLKLTSSSQIAVRILQHEENLSPSAVLLKLMRRIPGHRVYETAKEVIFDPTDGATPQSLLRFIAKVCDISLDHLRVAKYFTDKYEWLVIKDTPHTQGKHKGGKRKCNLRQPPYNLQDGDILGVKNCQDDPENQNDFSTLADDEGRERLQGEEKEKKQRKKEKRTRRAEIPLIIRVHDR